MTAPVTADRQDRSTRTGRVSAAVLAVLLACAVSFGLGALLPSTAAAQGGVTTTTDPIDNRRLGDIIPEPNSGKAPETPGEPGGWLQVSLFFLICGAVIAMVLAVWLQGRRARARRAAAGLDPVDLARQRGEGVRQPR
jgi:hypothetical protein